MLGAGIKMTAVSLKMSKSAYVDHSDINELESPPRLQKLFRNYYLPQGHPPFSLFSFFTCFDLSAV